MIVKVTSANKMEWPSRLTPSVSRYRVGDWLVIDSEGIVINACSTKAQAVSISNLVGI